MDTIEWATLKNGSIITLQCQNCKIENTIKVKKSRINNYKTYKCHQCGNNDRFILKACRICSIKKHNSNYIKFDDGLNPICNDCWPTSNEYGCESSGKIHRRLSRKKLYYKDISKSRQYAKELKERTPESFIHAKFHEISKKQRDIKIDANYLVQLYHKQQGLCAITNLSMVHKYGSPNSISIDRIDSSIGYVDGNIQLVCQFINLGKKTFSNNEVKLFIETIRKCQ